MLFFSFFKTLVGKEVVVELKNDLAVRGTLHSVDQFLNVKLLQVTVDDRENFPHMVCARPPHLTLPTPLAPFLASTSPGAPPAPPHSNPSRRALSAAR
mmetsp:Transcript_43870/g.138247  ORF Transcript_43870/g.138247 Transcript_43870/m.138247 type:complete len:98 (+) Transcript_43870:70-363(+)